ncbi:MAG: sporulation peptidase YabG, partial [Alicyclobacillus sp.]|nr:sporulation peptidase YabG [Alicyclobacillus sp.]
MWKTGDLVTRKSYGHDLCFVVVDIDEQAAVAILKGLDVRLMADAPFDDLQAVTDEELRRFEAYRNQVESECLRLVRSRRAAEMEKR